jgi:dienelactone hydrolase
MSIILVSDVFGVTPALLAMSKKLGECTIVDPYNGQMMAFENEAAAYSTFVETVGLDNYLSCLIKVVETIEQPTRLIGFSVGAAIIWRLSEDKCNPLIQQAFCFYGSQIRNFTELSPKFAVNLVFPHSEPHFDVTALHYILAKKLNIDTKIVKYSHGFMNQNSNNYNHAGYTEYMNILSSLDELQ